MSKETNKQKTRYIYSHLLLLSQKKKKEKEKGYEVKYAKIMVAKYKYEAP